MTQAGLVNLITGAACVEDRVDVPRIYVQDAGVKDVRTVDSELPVFAWSITAAGGN